MHYLACIIVILVLHIVMYAQLIYSEKKKLRIMIEFDIFFFGTCMKIDQSITEFQRCFAARQMKGHVVVSSYRISDQGGTVWAYDVSICQKLLFTFEDSDMEDYFFILLGQNCNCFCR
jgi:hypothetical protein